MLTELPTPLWHQQVLDRYSKTKTQRHVSVFMLAQPHKVQSITSASTPFTVYTKV